MLKYAAKVCVYAFWELKNRWMSPSLLSHAFLLCLHMDHLQDMDEHVFLRSTIEGSLFMYTLYVWDGNRTDFTWNLAKYGIWWKSKLLYSRAERLKNEEWIIDAMLQWTPSSFHAYSKRETKRSCVLKLKRKYQNF